MKDIKLCPKYQPEYKFNNMKTIGYSKITRTKPPEELHSRVDPMFMKFLNVYPRHAEAFSRATYSAVKIDMQRYIKSINKCDVLPKKPDDSKLKLALDYTYRMYAPYLNGKKMQSTVEFNPNTSTGVPYHRMLNPTTGQYFRNKGEFLASDLAESEMVQFNSPLFSIFPKVEFLPTEEINDEKLRTVFNGEVTFIMKQKHMFDAQDEGLKAAAGDFFQQWSRYGFTRQYGGINDLAHAHEMLYRRLKEKYPELTEAEILQKMSDISGWDRVFSLMKEVYDLRKRWYEAYGPMNEFELKMFNYIQANITRPFCVLTNGQIIQRETGNVSGSGKTTSDNTIGHTIVEFYTMIDMFTTKNGRYPTYEEVVDHMIASLFGDDDLSSYWYTYFINGTTDDFREVYRANYAKFGLIIKDKAFKSQLTTVEGLEFLGATFHKRGDLYIGQPRFGKIFASICYILEKERNPQQHASIIEAASALGFHVQGEEGDYLRELLSDYSKFLIDQYKTQLPNSNLIFLSSVVAKNPDHKNLVYGQESRQFNVRDNNFFFSDVVESRQWEEVGFKTNMEAVKIYDFYVCDQFGGRTLVPDLEKLFKPEFNYIGALLETAQSGMGETPIFTVNMLTGIGQPHAPVFECILKFNTKYQKFSSVAFGRDKQTAKNRAAFVVYHHFKSLGVGLYPSTVINQEPQRKPGMDDQLVKTDRQSCPSAPLRIDRNEQEVRQLLALSKFISSIKTYLALDPSERIYHELSSILDLSDWDGASRLAMMFKEGGFNPYGNGQTETIGFVTVYQPRIEPTGNGYSCAGTIFVGKDALLCYATGPTASEAFDAWQANANSHMSGWNPSFKIPILEKLRKIPCPVDKEHPLFYIWSEQDPHRQFLNEFKEGSFNPYGNGMIDSLPEVLKLSIELVVLFAVLMEGVFNPYGNGQTKQLSKAEYVKSLPNNLTAAQRNEKWKKYINKRNNVNVQQTVSKPQQVRKAVQKTPVGAKKEVIKYSNNQAYTNSKDRARQKANVVMGMSPCAKNYAVALLCPFWFLDGTCDQKVEGLGKMNRAEAPCIPMMPAVYSRKFNSFARGTAGVNAGGFFYLVVRPRWLASDVGATDSNGIVQYSSTAWPGVGNFPTLDTGAALGAGSVNLGTNSEYPMASLVLNAAFSGVNYRVVGCGVRFRYTGPVLNQAGVFHCVTEPDHNSLDRLTLADYTNFDTYFKVVVTEQWTEMTTTPVMQDEFEYYGDWHVNPLIHTFVPGSSFNAHMGVMGIGLAPGNYIDWEVICHYEAVGKLVRGKTKTPVDTLGTGVALNAINADSQKVVNSGESVPDMLANGLKDGVTNLMKTAITPLKGMISDIPGALMGL